MTDSDRAYKIAEGRIEKALNRGGEQLRLKLGEANATVLSLSPDYRAGTFKPGIEPALTALESLPPGIIELTGLTTLALSNTRIADISYLKRMEAMHTLYLDNTQVVDLSPLQHIEAMRALGLSGTKVADLSPLQALEAIRGLYFADTLVADLSPLRRMEAMQWLYFSNTQVADLSPLQNMEAMRELHLHNTHVADLSPLQRMDAMQVLRLDNTQVADLSPLQRMEAMQSLHLNDTQADLSALVAPGAAWEDEDRELSYVRFRNVPVEDSALAEIGARSGDEAVGAAMLARLRELRDAKPPEDDAPPLPAQPRLCENVR